MVTSRKVFVRTGLATALALLPLKLTTGGVAVNDACAGDYGCKMAVNWICSTIHADYVGFCNAGDC